MLILTRIQDLKSELNLFKNNKLKIGFVPTMGALHSGHLSLIKACNAACDISVCSIFVNPRQFNDPEDLKRYPRTPEKDRALLESVNCTILFLPEYEDLYNDQQNEKYDFGALDQILEAKHRPGHFNGVAQVLRRFFEIVNPDMAFFGQKDYQQLLIVKALVKKMNIQTQIVPCLIEREPDGLAMSSRNALLSQEERKVAALIPIWMQKSLDLLRQKEVGEVKQEVEVWIRKVPQMKLDYFEICDLNTLKPLSIYRPSVNAIVLIAVYVGKIRLIDNLILSASAVKV